MECSVAFFRIPFLLCFDGVKVVSLNTQLLLL